MSTELQSQISAIRKQHIQATPLHQGRPSLFLTPQEAAAVDVRTVYDAAVSGLSSLRQYDARFESFFDNLLHPSSVDVQRELKTVEENKVIDEQVHSLLRLLSLFAHNPESHLVLEYLIRRFRIHEMNTDALLKCMFVAHDTKIFSKVVQLCSIEGTVWEFLSGVKKSGVPLPRSIVVQRATRDGSLLDVLCSIVQSALDVATTQSLSATSNSQVEIVKGADKILSFFTATVVEMAEERAFDDGKMRSIYVFLLEGLRQKKSAQLYLNGGEIIEQWRRASCMILVQLCRKTSFAKPLMKSLSSALAEAFVQCSSTNNNRASKLAGEMLSAMIILAQHQKIKISPAFLLKLFTDSTGDSSEISESGAIFIRLYVSLSASYDVSTLSAELSSALAGELTVRRNKADQVSTNDLLGISDAERITTALVAGKVIDVTSLRGLLVRLFQQVTDAKASLHTLPDLRQAYLDIIRLVSQMYPVEFDQCIKEVTSAAASATEESGSASSSSSGSNNTPSELLHRFLKDLFADKKYRLPDGQGVGLLLSLNSGIPQVRIQATQTFAESIALGAESSPDVVGICAAALQNLSDQDEEVAVVACRPKVVARIAEHVPAAELLEALQVGVAHWSFRASSSSAAAGGASVKAAGKVLNHILQSLREESVLRALASSGDEEWADWLFSVLVGLSAGSLAARYHSGRGDRGSENDFSAVFLAVQQQAAASASSSAVAAHLPLLKGLKIKEESSSEAIVEGLVKTISKNVSGDAEVLPVLSGFIATVQESLKTEKDLGSAVTALSLLLAVVAEITSSKKVSASAVKLVRSLLTAVCPLLLLAVEVADKNSAASVESPVLTSVVGHIKSFLTQHAAVLKLDSSTSAPAAVTDLDGLIRSVTQPLSLSAPVSRLVVRLLESRHASLLSLVGACIGSSASAHPAELFLRIALTDASTATADTVSVSPSVRAAAIQGLATFVASIASRTSSAASHAPLSVSDSIALMVVLPLAIASCSDSHDLVRRAGLSLARRIVSSLNAKGTLTLDKESKTRLSKALGTSSSDVQLSDIIAIAKVLTDREGTILMDPHAASAALVAEVFHAGQNNHHASSHVHLQHLCYWMVMEFGWSVPKVTLSVASLASSASIEDSWRFVSFMLNLVRDNSTAAAAATSSAEALCKALVRCLASFASASEETKTDIVQWIASYLTHNEGLAGVARTAVLELFSRGCFESASEAHKAALYTALVKEQLTHPGNADVLQAIASLQVSVQQPLKLLKEGLDVFGDSFKKLVKNSSSSSGNGATSTTVDDGNVLMEFDDAEDNPQLIGMSAPLQRLSALLEAVVPSINRVTEAHSAELGVIAVLLLDSLSLVNHASLKSVMIVEFVKALIIDAAFRCLSVAGKHILSCSASESGSSSTSTSTNKTPKKGSKPSGSSDSSVVIEGVSYEVYRIARVEKDVHTLLNCLGSAKLSQVHNSALNLLQTLIAINPASIFSSIRVLGELLSTSAAAVQLGREGLVENILKAFVSLMPREDLTVKQQPSAAGTFVVQEVLQALCERFQFMPHYRRSALTKLAVKTLRSDEALLAGITILLSHAYTSYETSTSTPSYGGVNNENTAPANSATATAPSQPLLLLSKSAHRKANRELRTSTPEEFFALAVEVLVGRSPATQVKSVVSLLKVTKQLLELAFEAQEEEEEEEDERLPVSVEKLGDYCSHLLSLRSKQALQGAASVDASDKKGHAATLAVLHLEFVLEILENKQFHQLLVMAVDANQETASDIQNHFLELADFILQLQALSSSVVQGLGSFSRRMEPILIRLEAAAPLRLSPKALSLQINSWCYEAIKVLQRLVDGPTFVTILQELISHDQIEVRQKALLILGERLEGMTNSGKNTAEINLYLDLNNTLRQVIQDLMPTLKPAAKGGSSSSAGASADDQHRNIGLAQSALMCIDVMAKFLARNPDWVKDLVDTLSEVMGLIAALTGLTDPQCSGSSSSSKGQKISVNSTVEYLKLQGSAFLCSGTLCGQLGPKALAQLSTLMSNHLNCLEAHGTVLLSTDVSSLSTSEEADELTLFKTRALFVRSILSSLTVIINELPSFVHPYVQRTLTSSLRLHGISHIRDVESDVDRCLSAIAGKIPPRLSVPALLETTPVVLGTGHNAAGRFAELLAEVWINLDRNTVKSHLNSLSRIATLLLDYRRAFGDQTAEGDEVDDLVADAVVELCLKLTESELKTFLNSLSEWRDVSTSSSETEEWRQHSRSVSFYALVEALSDKLKHLFLPSMGLLWTNISELLSEFTGVVSSAVAATAAAEDNKSKKDKKEKKRKHEEHTEDSQHTASGAAANSTVVEVIALARKLLSCVKISCNNDTTDNFLDEQRYELMMPSVVSLINQRAAFADDDSFLVFAEEYLTPCLTALAVNIGKDVLWKPLNHKVLLATRDKRKAVRMVAIKTLHQLYSEVGEEYLIQLPECLPFLSELMEDDAREVTALTQETILFLEELSGEKLDRYLQ